MSSSRESDWHGPRGRGRRLIRPLGWTRVAALALAIAGVVLQGPAGVMAGRLLVLALLGASVGRVLFLAQRWWRLGDHGFASVAVLLLAILAAGTAVTLAR